MKICPKCGAEFSDDFQYCGRCGQGLVAKTEVAFCPHCGQKLGNDVEAFCPYCGQKLNLEPGAQSVTPPASGMDNPKVDPKVDPKAGNASSSHKMGIILVLACIVFVFIMLNGQGSNSTATKTNKGTVPAQTSTSQTSGKHFINIATGGTAGTYFPLGGALADILNKNIKDVNASAQSTGASVANSNLLKEGKVDLAFIQSDIVYYAVNGTEMFKDKKISSLRAICSLYPENVQIIATARSGIRTIRDMKGKKIAVGAAGSGTEANARQIMEASGVNYRDIKVQYLSFGEAAMALKNENVDAAFLTAGVPTAAVQDLATSSKIVLVPVDEDVINKLMNQYPFYTRIIIRANTYANQNSDCPGVAVSAMIVANDKLSDQLGYEIAKALYTNLDRMKRVHSVAKGITKKRALYGIGIKMNSGAERYLKEN